MLNFSCHLFLQIFQNLNIKPASTSHEFKFVLGTHLLQRQGTSKNLWVFLSWLMLPSLFFPVSFRSEKVLHILFELILFLTCKNLNKIIEFQWQPFQAKKKSIAKTVALNYISPKVYRITHHAQIFTVTSLLLLSENFARKIWREYFESSCSSPAEIVAQVPVEDLFFNLLRLHQMLLEKTEKL